MFCYHSWWIKYVKINECIENKRLSFIYIVVSSHSQLALSLIIFSLRSTRITRSSSFSRLVVQLSLPRYVRSQTALFVMHHTVPGVRFLFHPVNLILITLPILLILDTSCHHILHRHKDYQFFTVSLKPTFYTSSFHLGLFYSATLTVRSADRCYVRPSACRSSSRVLCQND